MSYEATICRIKTSPHPKADRLQLAEAAGYSCVVGLDHKDGDLGIVFPEGGQIVHEFCMANKLYRKDPETQEDMGGYLDENRRIRAVKLRGVESDALWLPLSAVSGWLVEYGYKCVALKEGKSYSAVGDEPLCCKYLTPATIKAMQSKSKAVRTNCARRDALTEHYDTPKLRQATFPVGRAIFTEKLHGTSGRTGRVHVEQELGFFARMLNLLPLVNIQRKKGWEGVTGTRRTVFDMVADPNSIRTQAHELIAPYLVEGEVWYYEIVGFWETGSPIMHPHTIKGAIGDSKLEKRITRENGGQERMVYHYGCTSDGPMPNSPMLPGEARFKVFVYRITHNDGDLPWDIMKMRVDDVHASLPLGSRRFLQTVPLVADRSAGSWDARDMRSYADELTRDPSLVGGLPIREGVCMRIETAHSLGTTIHRTVKHKGFVFCAFEGRRNNDPNFVDLEEVS
jgi:hypothetical protein